MAHQGNQSDEDAALFRAVIGDVQPIGNTNRITPQRAPRQPKPAESNTAYQVPDMLSDFHDTPPPDEYLSNGLSRITLRKLRRGYWPVSDKLDLHGLHSDAARKLLQSFLQVAVERNLRCVLVIHGKGLNSVGGQAILKLHTRNWLRQHTGVLAYCDALPKDGGHGAVLVLLKLIP